MIGLTKSTGIGMVALVPTVDLSFLALAVVALAVRTLGIIGHRENRKIINIV